jgi:hypothetical protein
MLGNDVVDLEDPETRPETFRPRFDERVFDPVERRAIARDPRPHARRWAHWAAKEAAYKLARRVDPRFVFSPRRLVARFEEQEAAGATGFQRRGSLSLPAGLLAGDMGRLELRWTEEGAALHVVARPGGSDWGAVTTALEAIEEDQDPSRSVRALARGCIARDLGIELERVQIGMQGRLPLVEIDQAPSRCTLSLSHHGRFVACALAVDAEGLVARDKATLAVANAPFAAARRPKVG